MPLPEGWEWQPVGELAADEPRAITDGPFGSNLKSAHYTEAGPRVIRLQNIGDGAFVESEAHISDEHFEALRAHEAMAGDVVVASLGDELPRACVVPTWLGPAIVKADCPRIRVRPEVNPHFLALVLNSPVVRQQAARIIHGVGRRRLRLADLKKLLIPTPPVDEQDQIVKTVETCLAAIDDADEPLRAAERQLVALRAAVLQRAVAAGQEQPLGHLLEGIEAGRSFRCHGHPAPNDKWGVVKVSAMTWGDFREQENKEVIDESMVDERWEIRNGDLLISRANTSDYVGAVVLVRETRPKLLLSDKSLRLLPRTAEVCGEWLSYALNAPLSRKQMSTAATGTSDSMRNLSQDKIKALTLRVPPLAVQEDLARQIEVEMAAALQLQGVITMQLKRSDSLRKAVLRDALDGRLSVADAKDAA
jgi:type I restriction enzyme S subunit